MNALTEAIRQQYQRRKNAIEWRDNDLDALYQSGMESALNNIDVYRALRDTVHRYYQPRIDDATRLIEVLEAVRDASESEVMPTET